MASSSDGTLYYQEAIDAITSLQHVNVLGEGARAAIAGMMVDDAPARESARLSSSLDCRAVSAIAAAPATNEIDAKMCAAGRSCCRAP